MTLFNRLLIHRRYVRNLRYTVEMTSKHNGALVISLDFELHWGVRDTTPLDGGYRQKILGTWDAVPKMLALFEEFDIAATWATVGFLFAKSKQELERFSPSVKPRYVNSVLSPYQEPIGESEIDDPFHFAPSLIEAIRQTPRQELATHTFSHYYCLEPGQDRETFKADLSSALSIARENGVHIQSIVFPRNQYNVRYDDLLIGAGIKCCRTRGSRDTKIGGIRGPTMLSTAKVFEKTKLTSNVRLLDHYLDFSGPRTFPWDTIQGGRLCNIPDSFSMSSYSPRWKRFEPLRLRRILKGIRHAAISNEVFHIWWHPETFGSHTDQNIAFLRRILESFRHYRNSHRMSSLSMADAAAVVREDYK